MFDWKFFILYGISYSHIDCSIVKEWDKIKFFATKKSCVDYMNKEVFSWYKVCISVT